MAPSEADEIVRIAQLEKGHLDLRESMHSIRNTLQVMQRDSDTRDKKFDAFVEEQHQIAIERQKEARGRALGPTAIVGLVVGAITVSSAVLGALVWLIQSFTGQTVIQTNNLANQTADRFNVFQDSIRSIREGDTKRDANVGDVRVALGRIEDRTAIMEKRWDAWDRSDWPGINATQSAEIAANRSRIDRMESKQDDRIRRELEQRGSNAEVR